MGMFHTQVIPVLDFIIYVGRSCFKVTLIAPCLKRNTNAFVTCNEKDVTL